MYADRSTVATNDGSFRSMYTRLKEVVRPNRIPVQDALSIMGTSIHQLSFVVEKYKLDKDFLKNNNQLARIPYTRAELEWAAIHGGVLTPVCVSVHEIIRKARCTIRFPEVLRQHGGKETFGGPIKPYWQLLHRPSTLSEERNQLRSQPRNMRKKMSASAFLPLISCVYLDRELCGRTTVESRSTLTVIYLNAGNLDQKQHQLKLRVLVGMKDSQILVQLARDAHDSPAAPIAITWKPYKVAR